MRALMRNVSVAGVVLGLAGCGGGGDAGRAAPDRPAQAAAAPVDPCGLLTPEEIAAVVGTKVERTEPNQYGGTAVCNFYGQSITPLASLTVASGMPDVSTSTEMAAWRSAQTRTGSYADIKFLIEPIEGLGVPAIRNEIEGAGLATVEIAVRGRLLDVTTGDLNHSKALAPRAIVRMP